MVSHRTRAGLLLISLALTVPSTTVRPQESSQPTLRKIPGQTEKTKPTSTQEVIAQAEDHFKRGELALKGNNKAEARIEFDKAIDTVLESGVDMRSDPQLKRYYDELVERIFREEMPQGASGAEPQPKTQPAKPGFVEQKFEPSPLDELNSVTSDTAAKPRPTNPDVVVKNIPPNYAGNNPASVFSSVLRIKPNLLKGKFETTPEYLERVNKLLSQVHVDGAKTANDALTFVVAPSEDYDADSRVYTVKVDTDYDFSGTSYTEKVPEEISLSDHSARSVILWSTSRTLGSGVGRTAFGVRKRYTIRAYSTLKLILPTNKVSAWSDGLKIPEIPPAKARQLMGRVRVAIRGRLAFPFVSEETSYDTPTLTEPEEAHYIKFNIYFEPDAIYAFDRVTGEALGVADLNHLPTDRYGLRLSSSLTLTRPGEATKEVPAQNVPKPQEPQRGTNFPDKHVIVTFKPEPAYTQEARARGIAGVVRLSVTLNADGSIGEIEVIRGLPSGLTENAIEAAKGIRFIPAQKDGKAISEKKIFEYEFNLY
jgi:TonB family protein